MSKKVGFLAGMAATGVAAYVAFKSLSPEKQNDLKNKAQDTFEDLRDSAVDYAYFANDKLDDVRGRLTGNKELSPVEMMAKSYELADKAKEQTKDDVQNDDISVDLDLKDVLNQSDDKKEVSSEVLNPSDKDTTKD